MLLNCAAVSPTVVRDAPAVAQCRRREPSVAAPIRRAESALAALLSCRVGPVAVGLRARETEQGGGKGFAERLRLGRLEEDGFSFKESFIVRSYEVGINKRATVKTIANLLQEVGCNHLQSVGFSTDGFATTTIMRELRLIWVTSRMHIEIYEYPKWGDVVEIETWFQGVRRVGNRRDWILKDLATGLVIGRATSKFVMMNQDTRKLQRVSDEMEEEYLVFCPQTPRFALSEEENYSLKKIAKIEDPTDYSRLGLLSMPQEIIDTHELQSITLDFRRECQHDVMVDSLTSLDSEEILLSKSTNDHPSNQQHNHGSDYLHFLHLLRLSGTGLEINRARTIWRKLIRFALSEEEIYSLKKIAKIEDPTDYSRLGLLPQRADLDMNQQVNFVTYIGWVLESMPQEIIDTHELQTITLDFRRECQHDVMVDSLTSLDSEEILLSKSTNDHPSN